MGGGIGKIHNVSYTHRLVTESAEQLPTHARQCSNEEFSDVVSHVTKRNWLL